MDLLRNTSPQIVQMDASRLIPNPYNSRNHSPKQIRQIADSIREFGFTQPILINSEHGVVAGHGRLEAAKLIGLAKVPTLCLSHLTKAQLRAYGIADNRLSDLSSFERTRLAQEISMILEDAPDFDLELTGFDTSSIELILDVGESEQRRSDQLAELDVGPPVTRLGDLWTIGQHQLLCGDATDAASYRALMGRARAQLVVTDPPYNQKINGHVSGKGGHKHREFVMASGEMTEGEFVRFLTRSLGCAAKASIDGSLHYVFMDAAHLYELQVAGRSIHGTPINMCVWDKSPGAGMGSLYRSQHELVLVFKQGTRPHINNVELGKHGRNRTTVWKYPGLNSFSKNRDELLALHSTVKNVDMIGDIILDASRRGGLVLDPFGGSGTTMIAAERAGRRSRLMELDLGYCDVIIRRFKKEIGTEAIDAEGRSFTARETQLEDQP